MKTQTKESSLRDRPFPRPDRQGHPWSDSEIARLSASWAMGQTVPELAVTHKRSYKAIVMQLQKLFGAHEYKTWNPYLYQKVCDLQDELARIRKKS